MLEIRMGRSEKKGIRVDLLRRYAIKEDASARTKYKYKGLGSFLLDEGYDAQLLEVLEPEELLTLKNWLAEVEFAKQFKAIPEDLEKITVHVPPQFSAALLKLTTEAKRVNIDFVPNQAILESLLKTAKLVQSKVDKINGFASNILEKVGVSSNVEEQKTAQDDRVLFVALLEKLKQSIGTTCTELELEAQKLGKSKKISPSLLRELAGLEPGAGNLKIHNWYFYIAIMVLLKHGIDASTLIPIEKVAFYWAALNRHKLSLDDAIKMFVMNFRLDEEAVDIIKKGYDE